MKLRIRIANSRHILTLREINESSHHTLSLLSEQIKSQFAIECKFQLSLNGKDPLDGAERTLGELGIVSGDLVVVLMEHPTADLALNSASNVNREMARQSADKSEEGTNNECGFKQEHPSSDEGQHGAYSSAEDYTGPAHNEEASTSHIQGEGEEEEEDVIVDHEVNRYLNEPMLVRETTESSVPQLLQALYEQAEVTTSHQALCVVLHVLMNESGFITQSENAHDLPRDWRSRTAYKFDYIQMQCDTGIYSLTCVSLGPLLIVHGCVEIETELVFTCQLQLRPADYVTTLQNEAHLTYRNLAKLSSVFKDGMVYPLLQNSTTGIGQPLMASLSNLVLELQVAILKHLDCASLLRLSQTCKALNTVCKEPVLWRRLYLKHYGRKSNSDLSQDWLMLYKATYLQRKKMRAQFRMMVPVVPPFHRPYPPIPIAPTYPGFIGGDYDLNPDFQGIPGPLGGLGRGHGPLLPRLRFDPIGPLPRQRFPPGRGGGIWDSAGRLGPNRSGFGGFGPRMF